MSSIAWYAVPGPHYPPDGLEVLIALPSHPGADRVDCGRCMGGTFYLNRDHNSIPLFAHGVFAWAFLPEAPFRPGFDLGGAHPLSSVNQQPKKEES